MYLRIYLKIPKCNTHFLDLAIASSFHTSSLHARNGIKVVDAANLTEVTVIIARNNSATCQSKAND